MNNPHEHPLIDLPITLGDADRPQFGPSPLRDLYGRWWLMNELQKAALEYFATMTRESEDSR